MTSIVVLAATLAQLAVRPVPLRPGIGVAHSAVTTRSKQAQAFFDQGLAYIHSYVWLEAARSFNQALRLDPNIAAAYAELSIAYTELNDAPAAHDAIALARALAPKTSAREQAWIAARALQMDAEAAPADAAKLAAYRAALDAALKQLPNDVELLLARGKAESRDPADRGQGSIASAIPYYTKALALAPGQFAAHHFLAHAYENTGQVQPALVEAAAYARMAPNIPHARHMHGHELRRAGRVADAIAEFTAADELDRAYMTAEGIPPAFDWHYQHNLDLLATSYQYLGQNDKAEALFRKSFAIPSAMLEQEFNKREWPVFLIAEGRAPEALDAAKALIAQPAPLVQATGHIEAGEAYLALKQVPQAGAEYNAALRLMRGAEGAGLLADALRQLQGGVFLHSGRAVEGRAALQQAATDMRSRPGPDAWVETTFALEAMARMAREVGDWELAEWMARQMIDHDPNYAGSRRATELVEEHKRHTRR
ncbi:MAG TPA: tetratricopeptide repeat protein [Vicinamibacterales bacterium]|nr:tetratricopeptide repeat protein [Vicinamibacterales bacterium]